jgi:hypothetical protein
LIFLFSKSRDDRVQDDRLLDVRGVINTLEPPVNGKYDVALFWHTKKDNLFKPLATKWES